ncbi:MAG: hypothetical protein ACK4ME_11420 [Fimbriimonadales bacterium]
MCRLDGQRAQQSQQQVQRGVDVGAGLRVGQQLQGAVEQSMLGMPDGVRFCV